MKKLTFALLALVCLVFVASCTRKGCTDTKADNYDPEANKDDGSCNPPGFTVISNWSVTENCPSGNNSYLATISTSTTNQNQIIFKDFRNFIGSVKGTIKGNLLIIPLQTFNLDGNLARIIGQGTINTEGNSISFSYTFNVNGTSDFCVANYIKQ